MVSIGKTAEKGRGYLDKYTSGKNAGGTAVKSGIP
jgi:hypothetical protein